MRGQADDERLSTETDTDTAVVNRLEKGSNGLRLRMRGAVLDGHVACELSSKSQRDKRQRERPTTDWTSSGMDAPLDGLDFFFLCGCLLRTSYSGRGPHPSAVAASFSGPKPCNLSTLVQWSLGGRTRLGYLQLAPVYCTVILGIRLGMHHFHPELASTSCPSSLVCSRCSMLQ